MHLRHRDLLGILLQAVLLLMHEVIDEHWFQMSLCQDLGDTLASKLFVFFTADRVTTVIVDLLRHLLLEVVFGSLAVASFVLSAVLLGLLEDKQPGASL